MYYIYVYVCISSLLLAHTNYAIFIGLSLLLPPSVANPPWRELKRPQRRQSPLASICMVGQVSKPLQAAAFFFWIVDLQLQLHLHVRAIIRFGYVRGLSRRRLPFAQGELKSKAAFGGVGASVRASAAAAESISSALRLFENAGAFAPPFC